MRYKFGKIIIIALGGSIMHPGEIDVSFLKNFRRFILKWAKKNKKFIIVAGGGSIARDYQKASSKILRLEDEDKDWIGIHATIMNFLFFLTHFKINLLNFFK